MIQSSERVRGELGLRYEDVTQDGRLVLEAVPVALSDIWRKLLVPGEVREVMVGQGVIPILTRLAIDGTPGPFGIEHPLEVEGGYQLAHQADDAGQVVRLLLDMDATVSGPKGRTHLPPPDDAGAHAIAGRVRAEHVFTRPFAPPGERKVVALELGKSRFVPAARRPWLPASTVLEVPAQALPLDPTFVLDSPRLALGVTHTDSNQHVNSLVYPRAFEEASLRRLVALGRSTAVLARELEIAYRRPSFAGEQLQVVVRAFELGEKVICTGAFFGEGESPRELLKARVFVRLSLEA